MNNDKINLNLAIQPDLNCPKCKCPYFHQVVKLKIVPGLLIGANGTQLVPVPTFTCTNCNYEFSNEDVELQFKAKSHHPALTIMQNGGES